MNKILLFFLPWILTAMEIGNPAQPFLQKKGLLVEREKDWCVRFAYLDDLVYRMRFKEEFPTLEPAHPFYAQLSTHAGLVILNFFDRMDIYSLLGASQLEIANMVYTKPEFSWGVGGKLCIARVAKLSFGIDLKYFTTLQRPLYIFAPFPIDEDGNPISAGGYPYAILNDYYLSYQEIQGSFGVSYRNSLLSPYVHATYILSRLDPKPKTALIQMPGDPLNMADAPSKSVINQRRWGMAVGATLIGSPKATLTVESRFLNQYAVDVSGELRF